MFLSFFYVGTATQKDGFYSSWLNVALYSGIFICVGLVADCLSCTMISIPIMCHDANDYGIYSVPTEFSFAFFALVNYDVCWILIWK